MFVIGHDLGTSAVKSVLCDSEGRTLAFASAPLVVHRRGPLMAEQRPQDWLDAIGANTRALLAQAEIDASHVRAMSFAAQMQGTLLVDEAGAPLGDALIWLDMRAAEQSRAAVTGWPRVQGYGLFRLWRWLRITNGVPGLSGRDPVAKMLWLATHAKEQWQRAARVLDVLDFVLSYASGRFITSHDVANTTWLMDTRPQAMCWSDELCERLGIAKQKLPEIAASTEQAGTLSARAAAHWGLSTETRVFVGSGDLAAMAIGTGAIGLGEVAVAMGTSAWVSAHVPSRRHDLGTYTASICSAVDGAHLVVAHQEAGGACLSWLKQQAASDRGFDSLLALAEEAPSGAKGLLFLPWMNGEYAPVDDPYVRGGFLNLSFEHSLSHMGRALLEGVSYNVRWALAAVERLSASNAATLRVGGGAARSRLWCQILSDVTERTIVQVQAPEAAVARGAAFIALVGLTAIDGFASVPARVGVLAELRPNAETRALHDAGFARLTRFYHQHRAWHRTLNATQQTI